MFAIFAIQTNSLNYNCTEMFTFLMIKKRKPMDELK